MNIPTSLLARANNMCELCGAQSELIAYLVQTKTDEIDQNCVVICESCASVIEENEVSQPNNLRFLTESIWSEVTAVKVLSYKLLQKISTTPWASETLESAYLSENELLWANSVQEEINNTVIHKDAYGSILQNGDNIFLTESLNVKGTNFIAPKGTKVSKIRLVPNNEEQIEGKINGSTIVILTKFVRKG